MNGWTPRPPIPEYRKWIALLDCLVHRPVETAFILTVAWPGLLWHEWWFRGR